MKLDNVEVWRPSRFQFKLVFVFVQNGLRKEYSFTFYKGDGFKKVFEDLMDFIKGLFLEE